MTSPVHLHSASQQVDIGVAHTPDSRQFPSADPGSGIENSGRIGKDGVNQGVPHGSPMHGAILPNNLTAGLSSGGMNVATGLCSALAALSTANGAQTSSRSPHTSRSPVGAHKSAANQSEAPTTFKSEMNFSPMNCSTLPDGMSTGQSIRQREYTSGVPSSNVSSSAGATPVSEGGEDRGYRNVKASIADRRSSFFNEITRSPASSAGIPPRSASQYSVPRSSQPFSLVHERSKRFERSDATSDGSDPSLSTTTAPTTSSRGAPGVTGPMYGYEGISRQTAVFGGQRDDRHDAHSSAKFGADTVNSANAEDRGITSIKLATTAGTISISNEPLSPTVETPLNAAATTAGPVPSPWKSDDGSRKQFFSGHMPKIGASKSADSPNDVFTDISTTDGGIKDLRVDNSKSGAVTPEPTSKGSCFVSSAVSASSSSGASAAHGGGAGSKAKKTTQWTLANKMHGSHSPGSRPKKSSNEQKDPTSSSPKQKETWKGKMARTFKRYGSGSVLSSSSDASSRVEDVIGAIGVPLELCQPATANEYVPSIVEVCTRVVEERGILNQGIYRVPGNTGLLNQLIEEINRDPVGLCQESDKWNDVNVATSLLKLFFRKLPDPLITDYLYESVIAANRTENAERRMLKIKKLLHDLPEHNFETLHFMAQHLNRVTMHEDVNKMDARNLAIMFGPTLIRPQDDNMIVMLRDMAAQCRVVESIIIHSDWFFSSWDEDVNVPVDDEPDESNPISTMNEELLAKAESLVLRQSPLSSPGFSHSSSATSGATSHSNVYTSSPRGDSVRYRELVSTIISAANRKIRHKGPTQLKGTRVGRRVGGSAEDVSKQQEPSSEGNDESDRERFNDDVEYDVTHYAAYRFESSDGARDLKSTENAKPCMRRSQSSESLLGGGSSVVTGAGGSGGGIGATTSSTGKAFYEEFTIRTPPRGFIVSTQVSPQLRAQLLIKRQMQAKQQFLLNQPHQQQLSHMRIQLKGAHELSSTPAHPFSTLPSPSSQVPSVLITEEKLCSSGNTNNNDSIVLEPQVSNT